MITAQEALQRTIEHREIFHDEMLHLMRQIMAGEISPVMTAAILTGLRVKKETIGEISAAATVMRELATKVTTPHNPTSAPIDTSSAIFRLIRACLRLRGNMMPRTSTVRTMMHRP
mgnify:CR=1 FL=1